MGNELRRKKLFWIVNYPVQITDAWHMFKTATIVFFCIGVVFYKPIVNTWIDLLIIGTIFNLVFSLFYKKILIK